MPRADFFVHWYCLIEQVLPAQICLVSESFEDDIDEAARNKELNGIFKVDAILHIDKQIQQRLVQQFLALFLRR